MCFEFGLLFIYPLQIFSPRTCSLWKVHCFKLWRLWRVGGERVCTIFMAHTIHGTGVFTYCTWKPYTLRIARMDLRKIETIKGVHVSHLYQHINLEYSWWCQGTNFPLKKRWVLGREPFQNVIKGTLEMVMSPGCLNNKRKLLKPGISQILEGGQRGSIPWFPCILMYMKS